jgi:large subunit ribosomal protein L15
VLANGEVTKSFTVQVDKISESAKSKIEAAGGTVIPLGLVEA